MTGAVLSSGQAAAARLVPREAGLVGEEHPCAALREVEYEGPLVIESFTPDNQTIARAAAIWRPLAETQEALAEDGLAFLQGALG